VRTEPEFFIPCGESIQTGSRYKYGLDRDMVGADVGKPEPVDD
jgi:hypothetical protein